jgi:hypothetical protein
MLNDSLTCKLIDFGIARSVETKKKHMTGNIGTVAVYHITKVSNIFSILPQKSLYLPFRILKKQMYTVLPF